MAEKMDLNNCELTILMPCLNEAETLKTCIVKAQNFIKNNNINGEILIADNGSTDGSQDIAKENGAIVINVKEKGYGSALLGGINKANGKYIIMGDADDSYDFFKLEEFLSKLRQGFDVVMGNRFKGGIAPKAMPWLHKYIGNPILSYLGRLFFNIPCKDFHCGLRGFNREKIIQLNLRTTGMEFASEMVVRSALSHLKITEVPTTLSPDGRTRPPHLRTWRDGWRHLCFLLMYSPKWLFLYPSTLLFIIGLTTIINLFTGPLTINNVTFENKTFFAGCLCMLISIQCFSIGLFVRRYASERNLLPDSKYKFWLNKITLESGSFIGLSLSGVGLTGFIWCVIQWSEVSFGDLKSDIVSRVMILSMTLLASGIQTFCISFLGSIISIKNLDHN